LQVRSYVAFIMLSLPVINPAYNYWTIGWRGAMMRHAEEA
jgi:hypothetical protein